MKATKRRSLFISIWRTAALILVILLAQSLIFYTSSQTVVSPASGSALVLGETGIASEIQITVPQGSTVVKNVLVNNTFSNQSWIVVRVSYSITSQFPISVTSKNFLPFVSSIPAGSLSTPFAISVSVPSNTPTGNYIGGGSMEIRTGLLPPYNTTTLAFNITISVITRPQAPASVQLLLLDSLIVLVDCAVMVILIDVLIRRTI